MADDQSTDTPSPAPPVPTGRSWGLFIAILNGIILFLLFLWILPGMLYLGLVFPWVALVGAIVSLFEMRKRRKWALVALILNAVSVCFSLPVLLTYFNSS